MGPAALQSMCSVTKLWMKLSICSSSQEDSNYGILVNYKALKKEEQQEP